jgi:hypothetical protein
LDGDYIKNQSEHGVTTNYFVTNSKTLNLGTSIGIALSNNVLAGIGFDYFRNEDVRHNNLLIDRKYQAEKMNLKQHAFLPGIYSGYFHNTTNSILFNTKVKLRYGNLKSEIETGWTSIDYSDPGLFPIGGGVIGSAYSTRESIIKKEFSTASILPEISYFQNLVLAFQLVSVVLNIQLLIGNRTLPVLQ